MSDRVRKRIKRELTWGKKRGRTICRVCTGRIEHGDSMIEETLPEIQVFPNGQSGQLINRYHIECFSPRPPVRKAEIAFTRSDFEKAPEGAYAEAKRQLNAYFS